MADAIAFFRAFPQTRETLCCEVVAAWLEGQGVPIPYSRPVMLRMWRRGVRAGADAAARRLGFELVADASAGDIVLLLQSDGSEILGVCAGAAHVAAAGGAVLITTERPLAVWRRT